MPPAGKETRMFVTGEIEKAVEAASWRWKALDVAVKIAMPILLGVSAWTATTILDLDKRVQIIEATRYTRDDARNEREGLKDDLNEIKVLLAKQSVTVAEVKKGLESLETRLDK